MLTTPGVDEGQVPPAQRWLRRADDHQPFAYARGRDFIRFSDDTLWAHMSAGELRSARSGTCLAYKIGPVLYDAATHEPLYYESA